MGIHKTRVRVRVSLTVTYWVVRHLRVLPDPVIAVLSVDACEMVLLDE